MLPLYDTNPHRRIPWFTLLIIAINVAAMFWLVSLPADDERQLDIQAVCVNYGFVPKRLHQLSDAKEITIELPRPHEGLAPEAEVEKPRKFRLKPNATEILVSLFTMMFLHGSWLHLGSNMWFLWIFGNNVEDRLGHIIYVAFYLLGGLLASACHWSYDPQSEIPVIGASGAVAAVLGAYLVTFPKAKVKTLIFLGVIITVVNLPALVVLGLWFLFQVTEALGLFQLHDQAGVAWWAHVGGFVAGAVLMPLLSLGAWPVDKDWRAEAEELFGKLRDPRQAEPEKKE